MTEGALRSRSRLDTALHALVAAVFPPVCAACERRGHWVCPRCEPTVRPIDQIACERCGTPALDACLCPELPPELTLVRSTYPFEGWVRDSVHALKFEGERARSEHLGPLAAEAGRALLPADWLVPVPLHPERMRQRGFNQSALLAREMGALLGVPVLDALQRRGSGIPQVELGLANRRLNVVDAFAARADAPLHGRVVILVDDVVTTGSTIGACARALVAAGAAEVRCASLARRVGAMP